MSKKELIFISCDKALQYLSNITGKRIKIANSVINNLKQIQFQNKDKFIKYINKLSKTQKKSLLSDINKINENHKKQFDSMKTLFHGTTNEISKKIKNNGFKLTEGKRSGFMGLKKKVDNLAIFLADNKTLARAYGTNRDPYDGQDTNVIEVKADIKNTLNMTKWNTSIPLSIRKIAIKLISNYEGKEVKKPIQEDIFWLIDQKEFINEVKNMGYDSIEFKESKKTKKELGNVSGNTIAIFNPNKINIIKPLINSLDDLYQFITK